MQTYTHREGKRPRRRAVRWIPLVALLAVALTSRVAQGARPPAVGALTYYHWDGTAKRSRIYTVTPGEAAHRVVYDQPGIMNQVKWSPDGTRLSFSNDGIHVMDADGSNVRKLVDEEFWATMAHTWGPDEGQITFYRPTSDVTGELVILDVANPGTQRFLYEGGLVYSPPVWSPDASRLAVCWREGRNPLDLYVIDAEGQAAVRLTEDARSGDVAWSPDGERLVYTAWRPDPLRDDRGGEATNVFVSDAEEGATPRLVATAPYYIQTPVWLDRGQWIAYALSGDVHVVNVSSGETHALGVRNGPAPILGFDWLDPFRAVPAQGKLPSQWARIRDPGRDPQASHVTEEGIE